MLGFKKTEILLPKPPMTDKTNTVTATYPLDMSGGVNGIYVYTDIVEHQFVGDKMAQLLRVLPVDWISDQHIYHINEKPYYIPVTRQRIDHIEISLRTDFGEPLVFESSKVMVKLHFKHVTARVSTCYGTPVRLYGLLFESSGLR